MNTAKIQFFKANSVETIDLNKIAFPLSIAISIMNAKF